MKIHTDKQLDECAKKIADLIAEVDSDQRHILYDKTAHELHNRDQHFTANLFTAIAAHDRGEK